MIRLISLIPIFAIIFSLNCSIKDEPINADHNIDNENTTPQEDYLALHYPNDQGLKDDPCILFIEEFDDDLETIFGRYTNIKNREDMYHDPDVPEGCYSQNSLRITNDTGRTDGGHLYKNFGTGFEDTIYLRYYVKYPLCSKGYTHHVSIRMGGYDPPTDWPQGIAGICNNMKALNLSYEQISTDGKMETYLYWFEMKPYSDENKCYGNKLIYNSGREKYINHDQWVCIEMMIKMNTPGQRDGELKIWHDGIVVCNFKPGNPKGSWLKDNYNHSSTGTPFEGFMWRSSVNPDLMLNNMKMEFYDTASPETGHYNYVLYDQVVMARKRIGPIYIPED